MATWAHSLRMAWLIALGVSAPWFLDPGPASANPAQPDGSIDCNKAEYTHDRPPDIASARAREIAHCGGPFRPGTTGFETYWDSVAKKCQAGEELHDVRSYLSSSARWNSKSYTRPDCTVIAKIIAMYNIKTSATNIAEGPKLAENRFNETINLLREQSAKGSKTAKLMMATKLLFIEDYSDTNIPDSREGIALMGELAQEGFRNQIFQLMSDFDKRYPDPRRVSHRQRVFLPIYRHLAEAGDARAWVILAASRALTAEREMKWSGAAAASPYLAEAKTQLAKAKSFANPQLAAEIQKVDSMIAAVEARHISMGQVIAGIAVLAAFASQFVDSSPPPKYSGVPLQDNCAGVKNAVQWDPSLAAAYAIGGCAPY